MARVSGCLVAAAMLALLGQLLLQMPQASPSGTEQRMRLRFVARVPPAAPVPMDAQPRRQSPDAPVGGVPPIAIPPPAAPPLTTPPHGSQRLFDEDGRVQIPDAATDAGSVLRTPGPPVFERRDPLARGVGERATADLFSRSAAGTRQSRAQRWIYGDDVQHADARPPPEVRFNPALHERRADLGREASGDAEPVAPIAFEKAPGLEGEASRRIRAAIGALESRHPRCAPAQLRTWMAPVLAPLDELQRVEYAYAHGADPVMAAHTLPRAADSAYDLARRALWYAEKKMAGCGG